MLRKLMKHEWKSVYKVGSIILLAILAVTILGTLFLSSSAVSNLFAAEAQGSMDEATEIGTVLLLVASYFAYLIMLMGGMYGIMIYMGVHFYKTMYTNQGYLAHTLPVTPHKLLLSKIVVSGTWMLLVNFALMVSMFVMVGALLLNGVQAANPEVDLGQVWQVFKNEFVYLMNNDPETRSFLISFALVMIFTLIFSPYFAMTMLFGSLTIGQLSKKHKVLMSILTYIGIIMFYSIISTIITFVSVLTSTISAVSDDSATFDAISVTYGGSLATMVFGAVILYFVAHYILSKKLNME